MGKICADAKVQDIAKIPGITKTLKQLGIEMGTLSDVEVSAAITRQATAMNISPEQLVKPQYKGLIADTIASIRNKKAVEQAALEEATNGKVGQAVLSLGKKVSKADPRRNKDTLYVFTDNLQAHNALVGEAERVSLDSLIAPIGGVTTNVESTSALMRTDSNGDKNPNAIGLIVKKNAQDENGRWIREEGVFQDTDEEFEVFKKLNGAAIDRIAQAVGIGGNKADYAHISLVKRIALDNAGLPKRFAETLAKMLEEKLGLTSQILLSEIGKDLYGLEIQPKAGVKSGSKSSDSKSESPKQKAAKEALASMNAERPTDEVPILNPESQKLLMRLFPDIAERRARVDFISTLFSERLTYYVNEVRNTLNEIPDEDLEDAERRAKKALNSGTESEQRVYTLGVVDSNGINVAQRIVADIKKVLNDFVDVYDQGEKGIEYIIEHNLMNEKDILGFDFAIEAQQNGWEGQRLDKIAHERVSYLANAFRQVMRTPNAFNALLNAAAESLEFNENIRFTANMDQVVETAADNQNVDEDGSAENRSGLNLIKFKLIDPAKTLSVRIKNLLSKQYKAEYSVSGGTRYVFNDLGQRVRMDAGVVYYKLMDSFCKMKRPEDFARVLNRVETDYPWFGEVKQMLMEDEDLRNEFYRAFRKVFVRYAVISPNGNIQFKNSTVAATAFIDALTKNYEGRIVLGANSIYSDTGECNADNVTKLRGLLDTPSAKHRKLDDEYYLKDHPLHWAFTVLNRGTRKNNVYTVENVRKALTLLRGELEGHGKVSLEKMLNNIGIDTTNMNLEAIIPYIDEETWDEIEKADNSLDMMEEYFTPEQISKVRNILIAAKNITHKEYGFKKGGNLINDFKSSYLMIANALAIASDGYSMSSFFHDGNQRFSYSAPDFISTMVASISDTESDDDIKYGTEYIQENFGKYDLYRNPKTGEWMSPWLEDFFTNLTVRKNFSTVNVLSIGNSSSNSIGRVSDEEFLDGLITSFFNGNREDGIEFGYYRNPLFSDTDALVLFKQRRYTGAGFDKEVLKRLTKVFRQELDRIIAAKSTPEGVKVEFYNDSKRDNAKKFCFFTAFRGREDEIISELKRLQNENNAVEYVRARDAYIEGLLSSMMEANVSAFKESLSNDRKLSLFSKILKSIENSTEKEGEEEDGNLGTVEEALKKGQADAQRSKEWKIEQVNNWLEEFYYNDYFAQSQLIQLLFGDLAYAEDIRDFVKRNKQAYASGEKLYARDENGEPIMETAIYLNDKNAVSNSWQSIKALLESSPMASMDKALIRGALESFKGIKETDGQSLRSLKSFKKIFKAMGGKWTDGMERAYNRIIKGEFGAEDFMALWNPIKPFLFSHESKMINGRNEKITVQHKNSEYLISAVYSMLNTALNHSPELVALNEFMDRHNVDVVHFHSVVKNGFHSPFDLGHDEDYFQHVISQNGGKFSIDGVTITADNYDSYVKALNKALFAEEISQDAYNEALQEFNFKNSENALYALEQQAVTTVTMESTDLDAMSPTYGRTFKQEMEVTNDDMFHIFPMEDYIVVQPSDDHLVDQVAVFGSQLRNIMPADLPKTFTMEVRIGDKSVVLNRDEAIKYYNTLIVDQLLDSFSAINEKFSEVKDLKAMLDAAMENNPKYGEDVRAALELNEDGTAFKMPFNSPNLTNKIEDLLLSVFKNHIQRQKINGGNVVLVSNFGLSNELHVKYKNDDPSQGVEYIPAYMPAHMRSIYQDYLVEKTETRPHGETVTYWTLDFDKLKENNEEELLNIIGYRIPTEDKYSIMPIKIVGFMPIVAGTTIMLPSDIIAMSGTDFDIDKLFLMIRNTRREIVGSNLVDLYDKWAKENYRTLDTVLSLDNKLFERFLNGDRSTGFTKAEIERLVGESNVFMDFWAEVGVEAMYDTPKYVIQRPPVEYGKDGKIDLDATSRMKSVDSRGTRKAMRDNMLIDTVWNILTSPEGSRLCMTPASYDNVKKASRQQRILHDPVALERFLEVYKESIKEKTLLGTLNSLSIEAMEKFMEENSIPADPMDIGFYVSTHRNLMDGNDLIGMFAVNSSSHYKFQFATLSIAKDNQFNITLPGQITRPVDRVDLQRSPLTGTAIGRVCAEFQAASPDNGKDPVLGDLGASTSTAFRIGFLARVGLDPQTIGILNTSNDLRAYGKSIKEEVDWHTFNGDISKILDLIVKLRTKGEIKSPMDRIEAAKFSLWMDNIDETARALQDSSCFSRSDSPNGALAVSSAEAIQQLLTVRDFMKEASSSRYPIQGLTSIVDANLEAGSMDEDTLRAAIMRKPIPRLQAFYTLGIRSAYPLCSRYLVQANDSIIEAVELLRRETGDIDTKTLLSKRGLKSLKTFLNELTMYLLSSDSIFSSDLKGKSILEKRNYYIHDFPMKFRSFLEAKNKDGEYLHKDVRDLTLVQMLTNASQKGIKFYNVGGKISPTSRKYFMEDLEYLLNHPDPEVQKLAMDLFMYSYYDNGLNFGHSNFGIFFTTAFMEAIPRYIQNLKSANGKALEDTNFLKRYVEQHLLNHPELLVEVRKSTLEEDPSDKNLVTIKGKGRNRVLYLNNGRVEAVKYMTTRDMLGNVTGVYQVVTDEEGYVDLKNPKYRKISYNTMLKKFSNPFYDANTPTEDMPWGELQERGYVVSSDVATKTSKKASDSKKSSDEGVASSLEEAEAAKDAAISEIAGNLEEDSKARNQEEIAQRTPDEEEVEKRRDEKMARIAEALGEVEKKKNNEPDLKEFNDTTDNENLVCVPE